MTVETRHDGIIVISDLIDGVLETRKYIGYTEEEAIDRFNIQVTEPRQKPEKDERTNNQ